MVGFLKKLVNGFIRLLEIIMVLCMALMLIMVFGNVMLRLFFNTGIDLSEELPRFAFIWMTFIGAVVGMHKHAHLGVDMIVQLLPNFGRRVCWGISQFIMLICCGYMVYGTWMQHDIISGNASPVAQLSMVWVYGVSYLSGTAIGLMCFANLVRLFSGTVPDSELVDVREEGMADAEEAERALATQNASGVRS